METGKKSDTRCNFSITSVVGLWLDSTNDSYATGRYCHIKSGFFSLFTNLSPVLEKTKDHLHSTHSPPSCDNIHLSQLCKVEICIPNIMLLGHMVKSILFSLTIDVYLKLAQLLVMFNEWVNRWGDGKIGKIHFVF